MYFNILEHENKYTPIGSNGVHGNGIHTNEVLSNVVHDNGLKIKLVRLYKTASTK